MKRGNLSSILNVCVVAARGIISSPTFIAPPGTVFSYFRASPKYLLSRSVPGLANPFLIPFQRSDITPRAVAPLPSDPIILL